MRTSQNTSAPKPFKGFLPNRKAIKLTILLLISPLYFFAQSLTGLWTGILRNDSNSVRKDQSFEIALTEYRGKVYGYSRSEFIVNDTLYYIVKRVKGTIDGDKCDVKDDEILSYNFPGKLDKGVKVTSTFYRNKKDSTWWLDGNWKTNQTKNYYSLSGKVALKEESDLAVSKLFPHLEELNLADDVAFYKEQKMGQPLMVMKTVTIRELNPQSSFLSTPDLSSSQTSIGNVNIKAIPIPVAERQVPVQSISEIGAAAISANDKVEKKDSISTFQQPVVINARTDDKNELMKKQTGARNDLHQSIKSSSSKTIPVDSDPLIVGKSNITPQVKMNVPIEESKTVSKIETAPNDLATKKADQVSTKNNPADIAKTNAKINNRATVIAEPQKTQVPPSKTDAVIASNKNNITTTKTENSKSIPAVTPSQNERTPEISTNIPSITLKDIGLSEISPRSVSSVVAGRKSEFAQTVMISSDSLQLSLYDNGEIDGDTVSVYLNGEVILSKQGLKASAIKKTIYFSNQKDDEMVLVLFADNLGKYPPNTGLLVVHDGEEVYNIRFSADLQKNAAIVFKRKR